ncbi:MAG TPA: hypothetical protein VIL86_10220 [Tepidisphaeraceae bacterium]
MANQPNQAAPPSPLQYQQPHTGATVDEPGMGMPVPIGFWQHPFVQNVLPFITSIALHAGLILLGILAVKVGSTIVQVVQEQIIVPDATIIEGAEIGGIPHPGLGGDPTRDAKQDKYPDVPANSEGWAEKPSQTLSTSLMGGGAGENNAGGMIGVGANNSFGSGHGVGSGSGTGVGSGSGDGSGPLAPFGVPGGGGGIGPKSPFMGISGNARLVAYVCDASGSMMSQFDNLRAELHKAVDVLKPIQSFSIVFFQDANCASVDAKLLPAVPDNKRRAYDFLDKVSAHGSTNPLPGLKLAFDQKPQLIYLLTDGDFPSNDEVRKYIRERNKDHSVKINTIAFVGNDESYLKFLKELASENGGTFKYVAADDIDGK